MRFAFVLAVAVCSAALAGDPTNEPVHIDHVELVVPDVIGVTLSARHVEYGRQIPYVKQEGDVVSDTDIHRLVRRKGKVVGTLVGKKGDLLCTMDKVVGTKFDTVSADDRTSYRITSTTDPNYR